MTTTNDQAKPPSTFAIFVMRMKSEGRHDEFKAKYKQIEAETGKKYTAIMWHLLKQCPEFGYVDTKTEQAWYDSHKDLALMDIKKAKNTERVRNYRAKKAEEAIEQDQRTEEQKFVDAIRNLPPTAPYDQEFDWLRSHPAMIRRANSAIGSKNVKVTADDILDSPNGKCPSQAVAYQLVNAANASASMVKAVFEKMLKAVADGESKKGGGPDNEWDGADAKQIADMEDLLKRTKESIDSAKS